MRLCIDDAEEPRLSERYKDRNVQLLDGGLTAIGHKVTHQVAQITANRDGLQSSAHIAVAEENGE